MAKIQVEVGGQLQNVTKSQLFDLAKSGDIAPETRLVVDGKETKARKVQGIEFAEDVAIESSISLPSTDNPFLSPDAQPTVPPPAPMPVPATDPVPQVEMTNRLLVLCLASLIPGLGHFLLGCDFYKCFTVCIKTIAKIALFVGMQFLLVCFILDISTSIVSHVNHKNNPFEAGWTDDMRKSWEEVVAAREAKEGRRAEANQPPIRFVITGVAFWLLLQTLVFAMIIGTTFWLVFPGLIADLKREYAKKQIEGGGY